MPDRQYPDTGRAPPSRKPPNRSALVELPGDIAGRLRLAALEMLGEQEHFDRFRPRRARLNVDDLPEILLQQVQQLPLGAALEGLGEEMSALLQHFHRKIGRAPV